MSDVVISFDSTGSMSPAIAEVRRKVEDFITTLFESVDGLRIGIINHGSYCDGERLIDIHDLSTDKNSLVNFLHKTRNTNGCDMSHASYEYVLQRARYLNWQSDTKALIMIGDCEPHPVGYRTDNYALFGLSGRTTINWFDEATELVRSGVKIFPIQALNRREHTGFYKALAEKSKTPKLDLMQFSDVREYLTAIIYKQKDNTFVEQYAAELQTQGLFNRNIAAMFNTLLDTDKYVINQQLQTRYTGDSSDLQEVDRARFQVLYVDHDTPISDFVRNTGARFKVGQGFYQLTKNELVQERKQVVLVDKKTGDMWSGNAARDMIGLPYGERGTVRPKYGFDYDVFIQSTSANRKLMGNTKFLYEAK